MPKKKIFKGAGTQGISKAKVKPITKVPRTGDEAKANARRNKSFQVRSQSKVLAPTAADTRAGGKAGGDALNRAAERRLQRETRSVTGKSGSKLPTKHANVVRTPNLSDTINKADDLQKRVKSLRKSMPKSGGGAGGSMGGGMKGGTLMQQLRKRNK